MLAIATCALIWAVLRFSRFGLIVRATMQNPDMAAALGVSPPLVYMVTFAAGSALAGLAGGILAPISGVSPGMGAAFIAKAFITVLGGGPAIITGTGLASFLFGTISELASFATTPVFGQVALLLAAIIMIRSAAAGHNRALSCGEAYETPGRHRKFSRHDGARRHHAVRRAPRMCSTCSALLQATVFVAMAVLALSQGFIWGYGGIMSFGQSAFFGLGGYTLTP